MVQFVPDFMEIFHFIWKGYCLQEMFPLQTQSTRAVITIGECIAPLIHINGQQIWVMDSMTNYQIINMWI